MIWTQKFQNKSRIGLDPDMIKEMISDFSSRIMQVFNVVTKEFKLFEGIVMRLWAIKIKGYVQVYKTYEDALNCYGLDAARILLGLDEVLDKDPRYHSENSSKVAMQLGNGGLHLVDKSQIHCH